MIVTVDILSPLLDPEKVQGFIDKYCEKYNSDEVNITGPILTRLYFIVVMNHKTCCHNLENQNQCAKAVPPPP